VAFVVENASNVTLYITLFDCAASGRVLLLGDKGVPKRSKHVFWLDDRLGDPFVASLPDDHTIGIDRIAAIGTTRSNMPLSHLIRHQSFDDLIYAEKRGGPDFGGRRGATEPEEAWTSALTAVRILRARKPWFGPALN
jgi:hypothetical protein